MGSYTPDKDLRLCTAHDFLWGRMDFIRKMGNKAAHTGKKVTKDQALLCLENLFIFMVSMTVSTCCVPSSVTFPHILQIW